MISYYIIDDEKRNNTYLQGLVSLHFPHLHCLGSSTFAKTGLENTKALLPNILFLDVDMPILSGLQIAEALSNTPIKIIFITAFSEYAVSAFETYAAGFITKPINTEKLINTISHTIKLLEQTDINQALKLLAKNKENLETIALNTIDSIIFIKPEELLYCESQGNYTQITLANGNKVLVTKQLGEFERLVNAETFIRVHDRYLINLQHIIKFDKTENLLYLLNDVSVPVSIRRKETLLNNFKKWMKK
jgi:two-component system, LytTR family, response regulator